MSNNYRNQRDRGEGWFDRTNPYENRNRSRNEDLSFRRTSTGDHSDNRFRNSGQRNDGNRNYDSWRMNSEFNRNEGEYRSHSPYENTSDRSWMNERDNDWNRSNWGDQGHSNENYRNSMQQGWGNRNLNTGNYSSPYSGNYERGNSSWRDESRDSDHNRDHERSWWDKTRDEVSSWFGDDDAQRRRRMDEIREGGYKGKGPKEYQRSPERIREDVYDRLSDNDYVDASDVQVKVENNEVILSGTVNSRQQKRMAEDIVESVSGVKHVENRIRVQENTSGSLFQNTTGNATGMNTGASDQPSTTNEIIRGVNQRKM